MRIMILENKKLRATLPAAVDSLSIGSDPSCSVHLPDPRVCQEQAKIARDAGGIWWLEVLDTSAPTSLNRAIQKGRAKLSHADEIELGPFSLRLFMDSEKSREEMQRERMASLAKRYAGTLPLNSIFRRFEQNLDVAKDQVVASALLSLRLSQFDKVRELLVPLLREVLRSFAGHCAWIGLRADVKGPFDWTLGLTDQGQPCDRPALSETMEARVMSDGLYICCPEIPNPGVLSAMAAPLVCATGALGMLYVENDGGEPYGPRALDAFSTLVCSAAIPIESVVRQSVAKRHAAVGLEMTIARATQDAITPRAMPQWTDLQVAAYRQMGRSRCCDYYDILQLPDKSASIILARVNVEGLPAPRYFAEVRAAFRCAALHGDAPHLFARSVNWLLAGGKGEHTVDLAAVTIVPASGKVHFCQAGDGVHLGVIESDGNCRKVAAAHGGPLGQIRTGQLDVRTLDLAHEETLVLASDGFRTARNAAGDVFGLEGLEECLCDGVGTAPGPALSEFASDLAEFLEGGQCTEDLTVVLARRN